MNEAPVAELQSSTKAACRPSQSTKRMSVVILALLIALVMLVWLGFLGWGAFTGIKWLLNVFKDFFFTQT